MYQPKLKYKPESLYKSDINDLIEDELSKGGQGSGVKGHITRHPKFKEWEQSHHNLNAHGHKRKLDGIRQKFKTGGMSQKDSGDLYDKMKFHQHQVEMKKSDGSLEKGGPGSGTKGHTTNTPLSYEQTMNKLGKLRHHDLLRQENVQLNQKIQEAMDSKDKEAEKKYRERRSKVVAMLPKEPR